MNCTHCGHPAQHGDKFCMSCGQPLAPQRSFCTQCGSPLRPEARFCSACGAASAQSRTQPAGASPSAPIPAPGTDVPRPPSASSEAAKMLCKRCGAQWVPGKKFCVQCGAPANAPAPSPAQTGAVERLLCRQCGAEWVSGKKFCTRCGAPADHAPAARPAPKAASPAPAATPAPAPNSEPDEATTNRWIDEELVALGLPAQYGLPPRRGHEPVIKYWRNSVALASAQIQEGMLKEAVLTMTQVIDDKMLQKFGYKPLMAASYYVRGLAYEKLGKLDVARADYDKSLRTSRLPLAAAARQRLK